MKNRDVLLALVLPLTALAFCTSCGAIKGMGESGAAVSVILALAASAAAVYLFIVNRRLRKRLFASAAILQAIEESIPDTLLSGSEREKIKRDRLLATQRSFQSLLDALPVPIIIVYDRNEEIAYVNDSLVELLGYASAEEIYSLSINGLLEEYPDGVAPTDKYADWASGAELRLKTKQGGVVEGLVAARPIDYREKRCSISIIKDLTAVKEQERMLRNAAESEKEANQLKGMFLANMSHEIRTPMNGIIGIADLLLGETEKLSGHQLDYVKEIKTSAESLLGIINDILDLSKINEGRLSVTPVDFDLYQLLKNATSIMSFSAKNKRIKFIDDVLIESPQYIRADDVRLNQVIINLLSNAIKFTKNGYVKLAARIDGGEILFEVSDTGVGIAPKDMPVIFNAFGQADVRRNRAIKGTGLGLSISKSLVELMGGRIWAESEYEKGSVFSFTIPYVPGDKTAAISAQRESGFQYIFAPAAQVLLVDDIQTNLTVGAGLLRLCGITADVAISGYEAVELASAKEYDLVLMDHMMPGMDGIETMKRIRELGPWYEKLPIVALTANAMTEARELLLSSGMNGFLAKPINKEELMGILRAWIPEHKLSQAAEPSQPWENAAYSDVLERASKIKGLDIELALSRISGMQDVLEASLKQAANSAEGQIKAMDAGLAGNDLKGFAILAHGLKGSLANVGAARASELAAELEIAAKAENGSLCVEKFTEFSDVIEEFARELKDIFANAGAADKPPGSAELLNEYIGAAIRDLEEFEIAPALKRLKELAGYSYGADTDGLLKNAVSAAEAFNYEGAISELRHIKQL